MKILVISHTYIAPINRDKWKAFAKNQSDVELKIIIPKTWPGHLYPIQAGDVSKENKQNCEFIPLKAFYVGNEMLYGYYPRKLIKILKTFRPDLIHVEQGDNSFSYFQTILFSKLLQLKSKFSFFTWINWTIKRSWKYNFFWQWIEKFNLYFSNYAIAGNQEAKKILLEKGFNKNILVLPQLGINQHIFKPATKIQKSNNKKIIGCIGRIVPEKGVLMLAKVFERLQQKYPEWNLLFVGTGSSEKQIIDFAIEKKLINRIEFKDPVTHENVVKILHEIDILVLPSYDTAYWKEQFGHILIEAMGCKVPIIGSTGGEIPNVIKNSGIVFTQKKEFELSSKLEMLMSDSKLRNKFGQLGYEHTIKHYTHEVIAKKTCKFWKASTT